MSAVSRGGNARQRLQAGQGRQRVELQSRQGATLLQERLCARAGALSVCQGWGLLDGRSLAESWGDSTAVGPRNPASVMDGATRNPSRS